jgi:hypothetical protein
MAEFNSVGHNRGYKKTTGRNLKESNKATSSTAPGVKFNFSGATVRVALKTIRFLSGLMSKAFGKGKSLYDFKVDKVENSKVQTHVKTPELAQLRSEAKAKVLEQIQTGKKARTKPKTKKQALQDKEDKIQEHKAQKELAKALAKTKKNFKLKKSDVKYRLEQIGYSGKDLNLQVKNIMSLPEEYQMATLDDIANSEEYYLGYSNKTEIIKDEEYVSEALTEIGFSDREVEDFFWDSRKNSKPFDFRNTLYKMLADKVRVHKKQLELDRSSSPNTSVDNNAVHMDIKQGHVYYNKSGKSEKLSSLQKKYQPQESSETVKNQKSEIVKNQKSETSQKKSELDHSSPSKTSIDNNDVHMDIKQGRVYYNKSGTSEKISNLQEKYQPQQSSKKTKNQTSKTSQKKSKPVDTTQHSTPANNDGISMDIKRGVVGYKK